MSSEILTAILGVASKRALNLSKEEIIKRLANKFRSGETVLAKNLENIDVAKLQKQTSEYQRFCDYVKDKRIRVLFHTGLSLQKIDKKNPKWTEIRDLLFSSYGVEGLHIAQFAQNGLFSKYFSVLMDRGLTDKQCSEEIISFFENIETTVSFVRREDNTSVVANTIITRIQANNPHIYVISSSTTAIKKCRQIKNKVMTNILGYEFTTYGQNDIIEVYFIKRKIQTEYSH